jgi:2'-5' RNA ligase
MKYFLGVVPPDPIYSTLLQIQQAHGDNRLEPHITLRPPVNPKHPDQWLQAVASIAAGCKPFQLRLTGTGNFGTRVLFVSVYGDPLSSLYGLLIPALKPFEPEQAVEHHRGYHPHLTLGRSWCGFSVEDFRQMKALADVFFAENNISFIVEKIRVYHKPDGHGRFQTFLDVPLGTLSGI